MQKYLAEAFGAFVLMFMGGASIIFMFDEIGALGVGLAFGSIVAILIYCLEPISGAHLNPAVSLALWASDRMHPQEMGVYMLAQIIGGLAGVLLLALMGANPADAATVVGEAGTLATIIFEFVATLIFVSVILNASQDGPTKHLAPLIIGLTLIVINLAGAGISGASVNPMRSIVTNIFSPESAKELWLYICAPSLGGLLAGVLSKTRWIKRP